MLSMYTAVKTADGKISDNVNGTAMLGATGEGVLCTSCIRCFLLRNGNVHGMAMLGASGSPLRLLSSRCSAVDAAAALLPTQPLLLPVKAS